MTYPSKLQINTKEQVTSIACAFPLEYLISILHMQALAESRRPLLYLADNHFLRHSFIQLLKPDTYYTSLCLATQKCFDRSTKRIWASLSFVTRYEYLTRFGGSPMSSVKQLCPLDSKFASFLLWLLPRLAQSPVSPLGLISFPRSG